MISKLRPAFVPLLLASLAIPLAAQETVPSAERLAALVERMEAERVANHIPGMALAVAPQDEVLLVHGFGLADLEQETPVTPETIFAIGSTSKAFTATLVGMLIDDGLMEWDDPVTKHLPWFELAIDDGGAGKAVTIRDLLCHRTGFSRMGVLWSAGTTTRETILRTATKAEPWDEFRKNFHYCNVTFMAAGEAAGAACGAGWDEAMRVRLLEPLGMQSSSLSVDEAQKSPHLARGYLWDLEKQEHERQEMRHLGSIAPAGSINSNALDMARWIRFQLGKGEIDGERLIRASRVTDTWKPQITIGGGVRYGLGWMLRKWKGQKLVEHGGNIDGFAAQVALLPDSDLGFVLLTNVTVNPLQSSSLHIVLETLLGEEAVSEGEAAEEDLGPYLGTYLASFGPFDEAEFEVLVQNERLALSIPGQGIVEFIGSGEDSRRVSTVRDSLALSFERNASGEVAWMILHDGPANLDLPRVGVEMEPEVPLDELQRYVGAYHDQTLKADIQVLVRHQRLALDVPDQMVYYLRPPNEEGVWDFRLMGNLGVEFHEDDEGRITGLTMHERGKTRDCPRVVAAAAEGALTLEKVLESLDLDERQRRLNALGTFRLTGTIRYPQAGVSGSLVTTARGTTHLREKWDLAPFGWSDRAIHAGRSRTLSVFKPFEEPEGRHLDQALLSQPGVAVGDWRLLFDEIELEGVEELDDREVYVLGMRKGELPALRFFVDVESGDLLRLEMSMIGMSGIQIPQTVVFEDFRDVQGVRLAMRQTSSTAQTGETVLEFTEVETGLDVPESFFVLERPKDD